MVEGALLGKFETITRTTTKLRVSDGTGTKSGNRTYDYLFCFRFGAFGLLRDERPAHAPKAGL